MNELTNTQVIVGVYVLAELGYNHKLLDNSLFVEFMQELKARNLVTNYLNY